MDCEYVEIGSHKESREVWSDFNNSVKIGENITIGLFTDVQEGDKVEWIPIIAGVEVEEWAGWEESLWTGLIAYYDFEEDSGNLIDIHRGLHNGTATGDGLTYSVDGALGDAIQFGGSADYFLVSDHVDLDNTGDFSYSLWINLTDSRSNSGILS